LGHRVRHAGSEVFLDQTEHEIHARGAAGGGVHAPVADVDRLGFHDDARVPVGQVRAIRPVRGGPPAVEHAGGGEQESPAAEARDAPAPSGRAAQPADKSWLVPRQVVLGGWADDESINRPVDRRIPAIHEQTHPRPSRKIPGRTLTSSVAYAGPRPVIVFTIWFATRNTSSAPITSMPSAHGSESSTMRRWLVPEGTDFAVVRRFMACFSHIRAVAAMPKITEFLPQMALPRWGRLPGSAADDRPMVQRARSAQGHRV